MSLPIPDYVLQHYQDPEREMALNRYFYLHGDIEESSESKNMLMTLSPLHVGDFIHIPINEEGQTEKREIQAIEYHEMDLKGLGSSEYIPILVFVE